MNFSSSFTQLPITRQGSNDLFKYAVGVTTFFILFLRGCKNLALPKSIFNLSALQAKDRISSCFYVSSTTNPTGTVPTYLGITLQLRHNNRLFPGKAHVLNQLFTNPNIMEVTHDAAAAQTNTHRHLGTRNGICDD